MAWADAVSRRRRANSIRKGTQAPRESSLQLRESSLKLSAKASMHVEFMRRAGCTMRVAFLIRSSRSSSPQIGKEAPSKLCIPIARKAPRKAIRKAPRKAIS
eukprot:3376776-Pleurochrysis_carterae.AAC.1